MRNIELTISTRTFRYTGPSCWAEVPAGMVLRLRALVQICTQDASRLIALPMLIYGISGRKMAVFFAKKTHHRHVAVSTLVEEADWATPTEALAGYGEALINSCNWAFHEDAPATWLLPEYWTGFTRVFAPGDRLANLTYKEFLLAHQYLDTDPARLCAILYRPGWLNSPHSKADARGPLNTDLEGLARKYFTGPEHEAFRAYVAWNYRGMLTHLAGVFRHVFARPKADDTPAPTTSNPWLNAALLLSDNDPTRFHAYESENLYLVLKMLDDRIKKNKEAEAQYKKK